MANIAIVTGNAGLDAPLNVRTNLLSLGHSVTIIESANLGTTDFSSYDVVVAAWLPYVDRLTNGPILRGLVDDGIPVLISMSDDNPTISISPATVSAMQLVTNIASGSGGSGSDDIGITDNSHPITTGFSLGKYNVFESPGNVWGIVWTASTLVGTHLANGDPDSGTVSGRRNLSAVDIGDLDRQGNALNARVVVWGSLTNNSSPFNASGEALLGRIINWLVPPSGDIAVPIRSGVIVGSRVRPTVHIDVPVSIRSGVVVGSEIVPRARESVPVAIRSGVVVGSRATARATHEVPVSIRSGVEVGSRADVTAALPSDKPAHIRSGIVVGSRIRPRVDVPVRLRSGVVVGSRAEPATDVEPPDGVTAAIRSGVVIGSRITVRVEAPVRIRSGVVIGTRQAFQFHRTVRIRSGVIVGSRDGYTGPGTGIVAAGHRFDVNRIREGDTFNVFLPWAGIEGTTALAHVKSRSISDQQAEQSLSLQTVPNPDPRLVPGMAGGGRPGLKPERSDIARRVARQDRGIDKLERER